MKKIFIILLLFLFSCNQNNQENLTWKEELQDCVEKSNLKNIEKPNIYWTFKNNWKCYYLWFSKNFFLIDENAKVDNWNLEYENKLYREEALDDKFSNIISKYWLWFPQELPPIYLFYPQTLDIFQKYLKKENIILGEKYLLVEKNTENFKDYLNETKNTWQNYSNQELDIKETLDLDLENLYQTLVNLQNK